MYEECGESSHSWDFIWLGYCVNRFITLRRWWNDFRTNPNPKMPKKFTRVRSMWGILTFFVPSQFTTCLKFLQLFLDAILLGYSLNRFITLRRWSNGIWKKSKSKNTKKFTRVESVWGILTFLVPANSPLHMGWLLIK